MSNKTSTIIILLIVGFLAVVLGLKLPKNTRPNEIQSNQGANSKAVDMNALIAEFPTASSTQAERDNFHNKIRNMASESDLLDISNCAPMPQIIHVKLNKPFTVKNTDKVERQLNHTQFTIVAPANSEKQVILDISAEGAFGYRCDGQLVGILWITP